MNYGQYISQPGDRVIETDSDEDDIYDYSDDRCNMILGRYNVI